MSETEKEELDVPETRRLIGLNSYDYNFNLVSYTSELRNSDGGFFAFVDFNADDVGQNKRMPSLSRIV